MRGGVSHEAVLRVVSKGEHVGAAKPAVVLGDGAAAEAFGPWRELQDCVVVVDDEVDGASGGAEVLARIVR